MTDIPLPDSSEQPAAELQCLLNGYRFTQALYVVEYLGIPDLLATGPRSAKELATVSGSHAPSLARVLRSLTALNVFAEIEPDVFALTQVGELLRSDVPGSQRAWLLFSGGDLYQQWGNLLHTVQTGETTTQHLYGLSMWEWRAEHPESNATFNDAMVEMATNRTAAVLAAYDFSRFRSVVDVGGGRGAFLASLLQAYSGMRGVLFDLPHVVEGAEALFENAGVSDRATIVAGNFFDTVPAGADAYVLSVVLHDWNDERATAILKTCRRMLDDRATLLLIERVLPATGGTEWEPYFSDLQMMLALDGRERTEVEWRRLAAGANFSLRGIYSTGTSTSVIEIVPD